MTELRVLGKIQDLRFGMGGYDDAMLGVSFTLGGDSWGINDFWGTWAQDPDEHCKWTYDEQSHQFAETTRRLRELLQTAKVKDIMKLVGKPIEATFDGNQLSSWRILSEVL